MPTRRRQLATTRIGAILLIAAAILLVSVGVSRALHRFTPPFVQATSLTSGEVGAVSGWAPDQWAFESNGDVIGNGNASWQIFIFSLLERDLGGVPGLSQVTFGAHNARNPSITRNGQFVQFRIAFEADGDLCADSANACDGTPVPVSGRQNLRLLDAHREDHAAHARRRRRAQSGHQRQRPLRRLRVHRRRERRRRRRRHRRAVPGRHVASRIVLSGTPLRSPARQSGAGHRHRPPDARWRHARRAELQRSRGRVRVARRSREQRRESGPAAHLSDHQGRAEAAHDRQRGGGAAALDQSKRHADRLRAGHRACGRRRAGQPESSSPSRAGRRRRRRR